MPKLEKQLEGSQTNSKALSDIAKKPEKPMKSNRLNS